jgi:hypothetical protein
VARVNIFFTFSWLLECRNHLEIEVRFLVDSYWVAALLLLAGCPHRENSKATATQQEAR